MCPDIKRYFPFGQQGGGRHVDADGNLQNPGARARARAGRGGGAANQLGGARLPVGKRGEVCSLSGKTVDKRSKSGNAASNQAKGFRGNGHTSGASMAKKRSEGLAFEGSGNRLGDGNEQEEINNWLESKEAEEGEIEEESKEETQKGVFIEKKVPYTHIQQWR